jgi:putative DNA primase/helicase
MSTVVQYEIGALLEMVGARPRGNRHDCPKGRGLRTATHSAEAFYCHKCGWKGNAVTLEKGLGIYRHLTSAEYKEIRCRHEPSNREGEAKRRERQDAACRLAQNILVESEPASATHSYLLRKRAQPHSIFERAGELLIPMRDADGVLWDLQRIPDSSEKRFLAGGRVIGLYHMIGTPSLRIWIAEGYATGASLYEATGDAVAVCFFAGNIWLAIEALVKKSPRVQVIIAADNDVNKLGNPGKTKAIEAARRCGLKAIWPTFPEGSTGTDFNDLAADIELDALRHETKSALQGK